MTKNAVKIEIFDKAIDEILSIAKTKSDKNNDNSDREI